MAKTKLESELDEAEMNWKVINKQVKERDNQIHDLKKENSDISWSLAEFKTKFSNLTAEVNKEKKKQKEPKETGSQRFIGELECQRP